MTIAARERGSIVLGWLTKLAVGLVLVGLVGFDAISIGAAHVSGSDDANSAAEAAVAAWQDSRDIQSAYDAAAQAVSDKDERVLTAGFTVDPDGSVHLRLERTATTLLTYRIGPLRHLTRITVEGDASPATP